MICALFVSVFTNTMVNVAIPLIRDQFGVSEAESGWVITGYALTFAVAVLSPFAGKLSDGLGPRNVLLVGLSFMLISTLVISSFAADAVPYIVTGGLLLLGIGYAGTNSPAANAASEAIPREVAGTGLGIYQLFFFLGSGSGPAVLGAFLASRRGAPGGAINPLYSLEATPFSDAFLLTTLDGKPKEADE